MKKLLLLLPVFALVWSCTGGEQGGSGTSSAELKTFIDSASYAQGMMMGKQIKDFQGDAGEVLINSAALKAGMDQALAGKEGIFLQAASAINEAAGAKFLAENATKDGVVTTESGLQYKVVRAGTGASPTASDKVEVNYEGRLLDGKIFDSSYDRGKPASFGVGGVIRGWTEVLQLMKEGAEYEVYIPAQLGYGAQGSPPDIEPGATLIFKVELLKVNP